MIGGELCYNYRKLLSILTLGWYGSPKKGTQMYGKNAFFVEDGENYGHALKFGVNSRHSYL